MLARSLQGQPILEPLTESTNSKQENLNDLDHFLRESGNEELLGLQFQPRLSEQQPVASTADSKLSAMIKLENCQEANTYNLNNRNPAGMRQLAHPMSTVATPIPSGISAGYSQHPMGGTPRMEQMQPHGMNCSYHSPGQYISSMSQPMVPNYGTRTAGGYYVESPTTVVKNASHAPSEKARRDRINDYIE